MMLLLPALSSLFKTCQDCGRIGFDEYRAVDAKRSFMFPTVNQR
jgi:hypothetical protein